MVFLIQNSQSRDSKATLLELNELIRAQTGARNALINLEGLSESEVHALESEFKRMKERYGHTGSVPQVRRPESPESP